MTISRGAVLTRATTMWPMGKVPYSQNTIQQPTGYRQDCSGYVSMCWDIPPNAAPGGWGGLNTETLVSGGWMRQIAWDDVKQGDAIGRCGPGSGGDAGHIILFDAWLNQDPNDDRFYGYEQAGGGPGPNRRLLDVVAGYLPYRYRDIVDNAPPVPPTPPVSTERQEFVNEIYRTMTLVRNLTAVPVGGGNTVAGEVNGVRAALDDITARLVRLEEHAAAPATAADIAAELIRQMKP